MPVTGPARPGGIEGRCAGSRASRPRRRLAASLGPTTTQGRGFCPNRLFTRSSGAVRPLAKCAGSSGAAEQDRIRFLRAERSNRIREQKDPHPYRDFDMGTGHFRAAGNGNSPDFGEYWICDPPTARRLTWTDHLFGVRPWPSHQDLVLAAVISPRAGSGHRRTPRPRPGRTRRTGCPACRRTNRCRAGRRTRRERLRD